MAHLRPLSPSKRNIKLFHFLRDRVKSEIENLLFGLEGKRAAR
jgi:hypothetical protein